MDFNEISILDIFELSELYVAVFNGPPWNDQWTMVTAVERMKQLIHSEGFYGFICSVETVPCGFILGQKENLYNETHFQIKEMGILGMEQNRDIGFLMMAELERVLKDSGVHKMYLLTDKINDIVNFYTNNGFKEWDSMMLLGKNIV
ncbi:GNAT family N-acetyltransferase [uncultured Vagococcus sp.]|uniref:GNAT family N-acetyltransferase n=1 Tax=uncultured Vagococcus sp. TaxID=189676 RepID=UPI0028D65A0C|nr:GNAT family N-acetyltransferase [uncultured Vagococcus sp.]